MTKQDIEVRALGWEAETSPEFKDEFYDTSVMIGHSYTIQRIEKCLLNLSLDGYSYTLNHNGLKIAVFGSLEAAKAFAQDHFKELIYSQLILEEK